MDNAERTTVAPWIWLKLFSSLLWWCDSIDQAAAATDRAAEIYCGKFPAERTPPLVEELAEPRWGRIGLASRGTLDALVTPERRWGELGVRIRLICAFGHVQVDTWQAARQVLFEDLEDPERAKRAGERRAFMMCAEPACAARREADLAAEKKYSDARREISWRLVDGLAERSRRERMWLGAMVRTALEMDQAVAGPRQLPTQEEVVALLSAGEVERWPRTSEEIRRAVAPDEDDPASGDDAFLSALGKDSKGNGEEVG